MALDVTSGLVMAAVIVLVFLMVMAKRLLPYRFSADPHHQEDSPAQYQPAQYQPMTRLLSEDDFVFLESRPGYRSEIGTKFRRDRRRIFRLYLRDLSQDFHQLHAEARKILAESQEQHSALVGVLIRQQLTFWRAMAGVELRLMASGIGVGTVDIRGLLEAIEGMRIDLARFTAPAPV